jgi:predicted dehydrogenase
MHNQWKIGLVGCSRGSAYGHLARRHPGSDVIALCDSDPDALARHQKDLEFSDSQCFLDYKDFINSTPKMDAVIIGTPIPAHADQSVLALDAGIHVMSEVTASNTIDGCRRIIEAARRSGRIYMLAENCIFRPMIAAWTQLVQQGKLGDIIYAEADYLHPVPELLRDPRTGREYWRAQRAPVHYCSHSLGPILWITGDRIVRAMAVGQGHRILPEVPVGGIDIQLAVFETEKQMIIKMTRNQVAPRHPPIHYYHLQGTKGFVETLRTDHGKGLLYLQSEMEHTQPFDWGETDASAPDWATLGGHGTSDYMTFQAFLHALDTGRKPVLDEVRAWDLTVPGLLAAESASNNGQWIDVPPPPHFDLSPSVW